jgi:hypothetical protein
VPAEVSWWIILAAPFFFIIFILVVVFLFVMSRERTELSLRLNGMRHATLVDDSGHPFIDVFVALAYDAQDFASLPLQPQAREVAERIREAGVVLHISTERTYRVDGSNQGVISCSRGARLVYVEFEGRPLQDGTEPNSYRITVPGRKQPFTIQFV